MWKSRWVNLGWWWSLDLKKWRSWVEVKEGVRWLLRKFVSSVRVVEIGRVGRGVREVSGGGVGGGGRWGGGDGVGRWWRRTFRVVVNVWGFFTDICMLDTGHKIEVI
ncbi:hypothetical protein AgCh_007914 [Apium graveolens]